MHRRICTLYKAVRRGGYKARSVRLFTFVLLFSLPLHLCRSEKLFLCIHYLTEFLSGMLPIKICNILLHASWLIAARPTDLVLGPISEEFENLKDYNTLRRSAKWINFKGNCQNLNNHNPFETDLTAKLQRFKIKHQLKFNIPFTFVRRALYGIENLETNRIEEVSAS
ncbi:hypothetical protein J3R30DRAFT_1812881 [Lentinula aciculospora]|uniref:Uncharacterized protein n=1 Tax=Lentinula aciculospora TaxID=153920 RepID=A0A9W9AIQ8_9AGAR|nr:hypothetical protein J3R30DRAFT_1812881 [Lentinula aciculospora]